MEFSFTIEIVPSTLNQLKMKDYKNPWLAELNVGVDGGGWNVWVKANIYKMSIPNF